MGQLPGVGHVHVHPVVLLQLHSGAQVALRGPRVTRPQGAQTLSVALHQDLGQSLALPPDEHSVAERGAVLDDELHPRVDVVAAAPADLQGAVLGAVRDAARGVGGHQVWIPAQRLGGSSVGEESCRRRQEHKCEVFQRVGGGCTCGVSLPIILPIT